MSSLRLLISRGVIEAPRNLQELAVQSVLDTSTYQERAIQLGTNYATHDAFTEIHAAIGEMIAQRGA